MKTVRRVACVFASLLLIVWAGPPVTAGLLHEDYLIETDLNRSFDPRIADTYFRDHIAPRLLVKQHGMKTARRRGTIGLHMLSERGSKPPPILTRFPNWLANLTDMPVDAFPTPVVVQPSEVPCAPDMDTCHGWRQDGDNLVSTLFITLEQKRHRLQGNMLTFYGSESWLIPFAGLFRADGQKLAERGFSDGRNCFTLRRFDDEGYITHSVTFIRSDLQPHLLNACITGQALWALGILPDAEDRQMPQFGNWPKDYELVWRLRQMDILALAALYLPQVKAGMEVDEFRASFMQHFPEVRQQAEYILAGDG